MSGLTTLRQWLPLAILTVAGFTFNTSELMPIGLLSDIAADFGVSEAYAGWLITVYAWVVALLSLPLMLLCARMDFRRVMLIIVSVFFISHAGSVMATGFWTLLASRIGVACAHAVFWSIAPSMAVAVAPGKERATALSVMVAGGGIAMVAGLPLGRLLGLVAGWRVTFAVLGVLAGLILYGIFRTVPSIPNNNSDSRRKDMLSGVLHSRGLFMIYFITAVTVTGYYTGYSYIEPFLQQVVGMSSEHTTLTLSLLGVAGLFASGVMSRWFGKYPHAIVLTACFAIPACLLLMLPASWLSPWAVAPLCMLWALSLTMFNIAFQNEIILFAPDNQAVAMSIYSGIFNLGIGGGAFVGGMVCRHNAMFAIGYAGGAIALVAALFCAVKFVPKMK